MAEIIKVNDRFDGIEATDTKGRKVVIHGRQPANLVDSFLSAFVFGGDPRPLVVIKSVFNIKGGRSGANALVTFGSSSSENDQRKIRLRETPEELRAAFREAALEDKFPAIQETRWSSVCRTLFGRPWHPAVAP